MNPLHTLHILVFESHDISLAESGDHWLSIHSRTGKAWVDIIPPNVAATTAEPKSLTKSQRAREIFA
jgi:hypothetical protein